MMIGTETIVKEDPTISTVTTQTATMIMTNMAVEAGNWTRSIFISTEASSMSLIIMLFRPVEITDLTEEMTAIRNSAIGTPDLDMPTFETNMTTG